MELYKSYISFFDKLAVPWTDGAEDFQDVYKRMMSGNPDAMKEYFNMLNETYKNSFGQVFNMSSFGLYKENVEAQMQGIDSYVQFVNIYNELIALVYKVIGTKLPGTGTIYLKQDLEFLKAVRIGDTIKAEVQVIEKLEKGRVMLQTRCYNQNDEIVVDGKALVLTPR